MKASARYVVLGVVTTVWVFSFVVTVFVDPGLVTLATLATTVMGAAAGWVFGADLLERRDRQRIPPTPDTEDTRR